MKKIISFLFFIGLFAQVSALKPIQMTCIHNGVEILFLEQVNAKYLGVTAFLENGKYFDFSPRPVPSEGTVYFFITPSNYKVIGYNARLWNERVSSTTSWSNQVVNFKGYLMKDPVTELFTCYS